MSSRTLRLADEDALRALLSRGRATYRGAGSQGVVPTHLAAVPAALASVACEPAKRTAKSMKPVPLKISEDELQIACFEWIERVRPQHKILTWLVHVPNGGKRPRGAAGRLKAMGVKKGVLDVILPLPYNGWTGLGIELKVGTNKPTEEQRGWLEAMAAAGYYTAVCYDFETFQGHVMRFLTLPNPDGEHVLAARFAEFLTKS